MKHLKLFEDITDLSYNRSSDDQEILDSIEGILIHLFDNGFKGEVYLGHDAVKFFVFKSYPNHGRNNNFLYNDISDSVRTILDYMRDKWGEISDEYLIATSSSTYHWYSEPTLMTEMVQLSVTINKGKIKEKNRGIFKKVSNYMKKFTNFK